MNSQERTFPFQFFSDKHFCLAQHKCNTQFYTELHSFMSKVPMNLYVGGHQFEFCWGLRLLLRPTIAI